MVAEIGRMTLDRSCEGQKRHHFPPRAPALFRQMILEAHLLCSRLRIIALQVQYVLYGLTSHDETAWDFPSSSVASCRVKSTQKHKSSAIYYTFSYYSLYLTDSLLLKLPLQVVANLHTAQAPSTSHYTMAEVGKSANFIKFRTDILSSLTIVYSEKWITLCGSRPVLRSDRKAHPLAKPSRQTCSSHYF